MSGVVLYKADDWYEYSDWFKQRPPPASLRSRVIIPYCHLLWGASRRNEFPYRIIQSAFEHGLRAGQLGMPACPCQGALAAAWIRGYYYASRQNGSATQIHPSLRLPSPEWRPLRAIRLDPSPRTAPQVIGTELQVIGDIYYLGSEWGRRMRGWRGVETHKGVNKPKEEILMPNPWYRENHINRLFDESGNHHKARAVTSDNLDTNSQNSYQSGIRNGFRDFRISASGASADTYGALGRNLASGSKKNFKLYGSKILTDFMSENQLRFHRAYRELEDIRQKEILWVYFVPEVSQERKINLLKITKSEYDRRLNLALEAIAEKIGLIDEIDALIKEVDALIKDAEALIKRKAIPKQISQGTAGSVWPCRIFSYANGFYNPKSPFVEGPIDPNIYCKRPNGELYAVVSTTEWMRLRRQGQLDNHMIDFRESRGQPVRITQGTKPIRILRQTRKRQWLVGKEDDLKHIKILKALEHIAIAWQTPEVDALKAIWGMEKPRASQKSSLANVSGPTYLDNDAFLPAYSSEDSFDQKAMSGYITREGVKILGIQSPEAQLQIKQILVEFEEKISEADEEGLTDLCKQHKKDMAAFKRSTTGSCIKKKISRPADDGDIFRSILHNLRERRTSAMAVLRKNGLHDEADDLESCYKIEKRTAIFFASRSRFTWKVDRE